MATRIRLFFRTGTAAGGEAGDGQSFQVPQLVPAGAKLAAFDDGEKTPGTDILEVQGDVDLVPGAGAAFSPDKRALQASHSGYPFLVREKQGSGEKVTVGIEPLVVLDEEGWTAKMTLYPPLEGEALPEIPEIMAVLEQRDVRWGVRKKNIQACIDAVKQHNQPRKDQVIARGRLPVNGEDAWLRIDVPFGGQAGKEQGDGRIDFRERRLFVGVDKGQLLATKVPATAGIPGINVHGREIPQSPGRDLAIKNCENIIFDAETGEIRAAFAGVLSVVSDCTLKVTSKLLIAEDVDYHTGNIDSRGGLEIKGTVKPGFKVVAGGDVLIGGGVESAHVASRGNVVIKGGVAGKEALVEAEGDVEVPAVRKGVIVSRADVQIGREAYYTEIRCRKDIHCGEQSRVVASELFAGGSVTVCEVDTDSSLSSLVAAATLPERYLRYQKLLEHYFKAQAAVESWYRRFGSGCDDSEIAELKAELIDAKKAVTSYNLVPGAGERDKSGGRRHACRQKIMVGGVIRAGAFVRIGNTETTLKKNYGNGYFALNSDTGAIEFHPKAKGPHGPVVETV